MNVPIPQYLLATLSPALRETIDTQQEVQKILAYLHLLTGEKEEVLLDFLRRRAMESPHSFRYVVNQIVGDISAAVIAGIPIAWDK